MRIRERKCFSDRFPDRFLNPASEMHLEEMASKKIITVFPRVQRTEREVGPMSSAFRT